MGGVSGVPGGLVAMPVGVILDFAGADPPPDWVKCEGQWLSRALFPALFAVISTTFNPIPDTVPVTDFAVPDFRDRVAVGSGTLTRGAKGGVSAVALTVAQMAAHDHGAAGSHAHNVWTGNAGGHAHSHGEHISGRVGIAAGTVAMMFDTDTYGINGYRNNVAGVGDHAHAAAMDAQGTHTHASNGGGATHENMPPYVVITKIIKSR